METTLYADILFLMNFSMDFINLWVAAMLCKAKKSALRMSLAAALGALGAVLCTVFSLPSLLSYSFAALLGGVMCIIAFGKARPRQILYRSAVVFVAGMLLGGIMSAFINLFGSQYNSSGQKTASLPALLIGASAVAAFFCARLLRRYTSKKCVEVTIRNKNSTSRFTALCDSGNLLCDPISGDAVAPVSKHILGQLYPKETLNALISMDTDKLIAGGLVVRIIPRKTSDKTLISCAVLPDYAEVDKTEVRLFILPVDCTSDYFGGYPATVPASIIK